MLLPFAVVCGGCLLVRKKVLVLWLVALVQVLQVLVVKVAVVLVARW